MNLLSKDSVIVTTISWHDCKGALMILTATDEIQGHQIESYRGVATGTAVVGQFDGRDFFSTNKQDSALNKKSNLSNPMGFLKALVSRFRRNLNYRTQSSYSALIENAKEFAMNDLQERAHAMGGNAVIAIRIEFHAWNQTLIASGTVVTINEQSV